MSRSLQEIQSFFLAGTLGLATVLLKPLVCHPLRKHADHDVAGRLAHLGL